MDDLTKCKKTFTQFHLDFHTNDLTSLEPEPVDLETDLFHQNFIIADTPCLSSSLSLHCVQMCMWAVGTANHNKAE